MSNNNNIGILDPEGINPNPINNQPYTENYKILAKKWSKLPAYEEARNIIDLIQKNQVLLIISSTGSGKSVLIPKLVWHTTNYKGNILMSLPKQITAQKVAEYASKTMDVKLGEEIGYQYKGSDKKAKSNKTKLLYATDGTIVSKLLKDPALKDYDAVIIDEAHERKVQIDFLLYLLRNTIQLRPNFKLIIMSATIDEKIFLSYFSTFKTKMLHLKGERLFPIDIIYLNKPITNREYVATGYNLIKKIINETETGDIIFFVPSINEAFDVCLNVNKDKLDDIFCIELYAGLSDDKTEMAVDKNIYKINSNKNRKLIVATGVAESSLTIDGIKFVIDSGYELNGFYDPLINAKVLEKKFITQSQAMQRAGRTGRTESGTCYRLYTEEQFNQFYIYPEPSIRTSNIYQECLNLLNYPTIQTIDNLLSILSQFIEPPKENYITDAIQQLQIIKLLDNKKITEFGTIIANMHIDPKMAVAFYYGRVLRCSNEVMAILSIIEVCKNRLSDLFIIPKPKTNESENGISKDNNNQIKKFYDAIDHFHNGYGDYVAIYKIINTYSTNYRNKKMNKIIDFTHKNYIKKNLLDKAYQNYQKYKYSLNNIKVEEIHTDATITDKFMACITTAYQNNIATLNNNDLFQFKKMNNIKINKFSFINLKKIKTKKIIFNEFLNNMGNLELNIIGNLTPEIIALYEKLNNMFLIY